MMKLKTFSASGFAIPSNPSDTTVSELVQKLDKQIEAWLSEHKLYREVERSVPSICATATEGSIYIVLAVNVCFEPV